MTDNGTYAELKTKAGTLRLYNSGQVTFKERFKQTWVVLRSWKKRNDKGMRKNCSHLRNCHHLRSVSNG
jgi:hypothetical protein